MTKNPYYITAIHEAAHIVYAYDEGYTCEWTKIITSEKNNAKTLLKFGSDSKIFHSLVARNHSKFEKIFSSQKESAFEIAKKIGKILAAGGCIEAIYLSKDPKLIFERDDLGSDLLKLNRIKLILSKYYNSSINFVDIVDFLTTKDTKFI